MWYLIILIFTFFLMDRINIISTDNKYPYFAIGIAILILIGVVIFI